MKYRLGIDLGSTSLGWCALKLNKNNLPCELLNLGVRIFPDGRDAKSRQPTSVNRREKRSQRRRRDRHIERRNKLLKLLIDAGLMPQENQLARKLKNSILINAEPMPLPNRFPSTNLGVPCFISTNAGALKAIGSSIMIRMLNWAA